MVGRAAIYASNPRQRMPDHPSGLLARPNSARWAPSGVQGGRLIASGKGIDMSADTLSDVLRAVRLTGAVFVTIDVSPPWSAPVPNAATLAPIIMPSAQHLISYHLVTEGDCWV